MGIVPPVPLIASVDQLGMPDGIGALIIGYEYFSLRDIRTKMYDLVINKNSDNIKQISALVDVAGLTDGEMVDLLKNLKSKKKSCRCSACLGVQRATCYLAH